MVGIALFSGVINLLMLSGSLYMLQVYDRVIPSRNIATLFGLSLMVLFAYLMQGYFDALRARMLCRVATLFDVGLQDSIHTALATLPLRGAQADGDAAAAARPRPDPRLHVEHGADGVPRHALDSDLPDRAVSVSSGDRHDRRCSAPLAIIAMTLLTERMSRGAAKAAMDTQRAAAGARRHDPAQCRGDPRARHGRSLRRRCGRRSTSAICAKTSAPPTSMPISAPAPRCCATSCSPACSASAPISWSPTRPPAAS